MKNVTKKFSPKATISLLGFMLLVFLYVAALAFTSNHGIIAFVFTVGAVICGSGIQDEAKKILKKVKI